MAKSSEFFFDLVRQIQQYRRKIEPVLDVMERVGLLLDRLEQAEQEESKVTQARLILDAIDDSLKVQPSHRATEEIERQVSSGISAKK
jgi:hypothetical protein